MIYELDMNTKTSPFYPWIGIFMGLSLKQFGQIYDELDFPFNPPEDLRQLAHDAAFTYVFLDRDSRYPSRQKAVLDDPIASTVTYNLLDGIPPDEPIRKKNQLLFANIFKQLEQMGYAEAVYRWGKESRQFYHHSLVNGLSSLLHLLHRWALLEARNHRILPENESYSSEWEDMVIRYDLRPYHGDFIVDPMPLSEVSQFAIRQITVYNVVKETHLHEVIEHLRVAPRNLWEDFVIYPTDSKLINEGNFRISLRVWNTLIERLSPDEVDTLEQWALQHKNRGRNGVTFAQNLCVLPRDFVASR